MKYKPTHAVGKCFLTALAGNEADALELEPGTTVEAFSRLYKNCVLYHSQAYSRSRGKRNNTICAFSEPERTVHVSSFSSSLSATENKLH